jgi:hypothetical protein
VLVRQALNMSPPEFATGLGAVVLDSDDPSDWPSLTQARPRRPWLAGALGEETWAEAFPRSGRPARLALAAALLQIHDFWDASHEAAQQADDLGERGYSVYWHGIAHRREPDAGNAAYWFRRVGRHSFFARLADEARPLVAVEDAAPVAASLLPRGSWDPFAFIDFCTNAAPGSDRWRLAQRLQRLEMRGLLEETVQVLKD